MLCFPSSVDSSCYYYQFSVLLVFSHFLLFPTDVSYASGSLLLLYSYIPPSALFAVVPLCPIISPTAPNKAREPPQCISATIVNTKVYTIFRATMHDTSTLWSRKKKRFSVYSKFRGRKMTFIPLLKNWATIVKSIKPRRTLALLVNFEVVFPVY